MGADTVLRLRSLGDRDHYSHARFLKRKQKHCPQCGDPLFKNRFHSCALVWARKDAERRTQTLLEVARNMPKAEPLYEDECEKEPSEWAMDLATILIPYDGRKVPMPGGYSSFIITTARRLDAARRETIEACAKLIDAAVGLDIHVRAKLAAAIRKQS